MREIEAFLSVAEELHFGRAAHRLRLTTSHVSQTIRRLERRVGAPLFERTSRHVVLTVLGKQLLADLGPAYRAMQHAMLAAQQGAQQTARQILHIGFAHTVASDVISRLINAFNAEQPGCRVVQSTHQSQWLARWFGPDGPRSEADVTVGWLPTLAAEAIPQWLTIGPVIRREPLSLLLAAHHPLAGRVSVDIEEVADHDTLYPPVPPVIADAWTPPATPAGRPIRRVNRGQRYVEEIFDILSGGDLIHLTYATLMDTWVLPGLVTVPLTGLPPLQLTTVWPSENTTDLIHLFADSAARTGAAAGWLE